MDEFEPSDYHRKALDDAIARHAALMEMSAQEAFDRMNAENGAALQRRIEVAKRDSATRANYERMIALVEGWEPPSPDHSKLKAFMLDQLRESIKWDCHDDQESLAVCYPVFSGTTDEWLAEKRARAASDIEYHRKHWQDESDRSAERTRWVRQLRESLASPRR